MLVLIDDTKGENGNEEEEENEEENNPNLSKTTNFKHTREDIVSSSKPY